MGNHQNSANDWYTSYKKDLKLLGLDHTLKTFKSKKSFYREQQKQHHSEFYSHENFVKLRQVDRKEIARDYNFGTLIANQIEETTHYQHCCMIIEKLFKKDSIFNLTFKEFKCKITLPFISVIIKFFLKSIKSYFNLDYYCQLYQPEHLRINNLNNLITNLVFDQDVYIYVYQELKSNDKNQIIYEKLQKPDKDPKHYGVSMKYCLPYRTTTYSERASEQEITPIQIEECDEINLNDAYQPYEKAIKMFWTIQCQQTPFFKLKTLNQTFKCIFNEIGTTYDEKTGMCCDELISLLSYVVHNSQVGQLYTHYEIMDRWCQDKQSLEGYYLTILEAVIEMMLH